MDLMVVLNYQQCLWIVVLILDNVRKVYLEGELMFYVLFVVGMCLDMGIDFMCNRTFA